MRTLGSDSYAAILRRELAEEKRKELKAERRAFLREMRRDSDAAISRRERDEEKREERKAVRQ